MAPSARVTITQIAREAGVSVGTVSRVLNGKNKDAWASAAETARQIRLIAERLNYRPSWAAKSMVQNRSHTVGVLIRNASDRLFVFPQAIETIVGINEYLTSADYMLSLVHLHEVTGDDAVPRVFRDRVLDGMIVLGGNMPEKAERVIDKIHRDVAPCVWVEGNRWHETGVLQRDEVYAGRLVAEKLIDAGYERLVMIGTRAGASVHYSERDRLAGVQRVADERGVELLVRQVGREPFHDELAEILRETDWSPTTAAIASGTRHASSLVTVACGMGLRVGADFGLACCDDDHSTEMIFPTLSRVSFDRFDLGVSAAKMMLGALSDDPEAIVSQRVRGQWLQRSTTTASPDAGQNPPPPAPH